MLQATHISGIWRALHQAFVLSALLACLSAFGGAAAEQAGVASPDLWDQAKYIRLAEIKPGMDAYCLTEYGLDGVEKFNMKVIDVLPDFNVGRDVILVKGTDERFIQTGPVAGCSGSPVYIDGRLAGALAYGWMYSKEPFYGVTLIEDMLKINQAAAKSPPLHSSFDFSQPINFAVHPQTDLAIGGFGKLTAGGLGFTRAYGVAQAGVLPCPLVTSGLPATVCDQLKAELEPLGFVVVPGVAGAGAQQSAVGGAGQSAAQPAGQKLVPGACLAVPLLSGDITLGTYGTVTEVRDDKVYGFGHAFLGYGSVDLPIAAGKVHTVIPSLARSFKVCSIGQTVGALTADEGAGIFGRLGAQAKTIPLTIRVERFNDPQKRVYNCRVANNELLTPSLVGVAVSGAALYLGDLPPDHTIIYKVSIGVDGFAPIAYENVSTSLSLLEMLTEVSGTDGAVSMLMTNPFREVAITSLEFDVRVTADNILSHIWSLDVADPKVEPGDKLNVEVVLESIRHEKKKYTLDIDVPDDLPPGRYELAVCGWREYEQFLAKVVPHRFIADNIDNLVKGLNDVLAISRNKLYFILQLPPGGVTVEKAEMPDLPATKALVLQNAKRALRVQPYMHWIEKNLKTGTIVLDRKSVPIVVEK
jgi:hypothetical protein